MTPTPDRLLGVHPRLVDRISKVLDAMAALGYPMMVTSGVRTDQQQQALYAQGRTAPGAIVTKLDGVKKRSNHQPKGDGWGYAVDCAFIVSGKPSWRDDLPWGAYGACAKALGLRWGGDWVGFVDRPHVELPYSGTEVKV